MPKFESQESNPREKPYATFYIYIYFSDLWLNDKNLEYEIQSIQLLQSKGSFKILPKIIYKISIEELYGIKRNQYYFTKSLR